MHSTRGPWTELVQECKGQQEVQTSFLPLHSWEVTLPPQGLTASFENSLDSQAETSCWVILMAESGCLRES